MDKFYRKEAYKPMIHSMASTLMHGFSISGNNSLVLALGHGNEKNNFEAMVSWIERIIDERDLAPQQLCISIFVSQLEYDLHDWLFRRYDY